MNIIFSRCWLIWTSHKCFYK